MEEMNTTSKVTTPLSGDYDSALVAEVCYLTKKGAGVDLSTWVPIARFERQLFWNEEYQYVLTPYYDVIDMLKSQGYAAGYIPGYDITLRQERYYRVNRVPSLLMSRVPPKNREDIRSLLDEVGMSSYDPLEYAMKTPYVYGIDNLIIRPLAWS